MAEDGRARWVRLLSLALPAAYRRDVVTDLLDEQKALIRSGRSRRWAAAWLLAHMVRSAIATRWIGSPGRAYAGSRRWWPAGGLPAFRQAARALRRTPWYAATIVAVVALSMALAATVFAVVDGVLFKSLPYPHSEELYAISGRFDEGPASGRGIEMVSAREIAAWSAAAPDVTMTGFLNSYIPLPDGPGVFASGVDSGFFRVFGVRLLIGGFREEDYAGDWPVTPVIISYRLWQDRFGGDPTIVGRTLPPTDNYTKPLRVAGILDREGFVPPLPGDSEVAARRSNRVEILFPNPNEAMSERSDTAFARIPEGELPRTQAALDSAVAADRAHAPVRPRPFDGVRLVPLRDYVSSRERPVLAMAFGMAMTLVLLVLLNVAALTTARAQHDARDLALRRALGAGTRDLLRHALAEQTVLFAAGAALGLLATPVLVAVVLDLLPQGMNLVKDVRLDWRVAAFAGGVAATAALAVALATVHAAVRRIHPWPTLTSTHATAPAQVRIGRLLVTGQTAVAFVLVVTGGLTSVSLARIWSEPPGLRVSDTATFSVFYRDYRERRSSRSWPDALALAQEFRAVPGVEGVALLDTSIMENGVLRSHFEAPAGQVDGVASPATVRVSSSFFRTAGIQVRAGRLPTDRELDGGAPVVVVTEAAARAYWPQRTPIGRTLRTRPPRGGEPLECTVVGVVPDVRFLALDIPSTGVIFVSWAVPVFSGTGPRFLIATKPGVPDALSQVVDRLSVLAPTARVSNLRLLENAASDSIRERRLLTLMASTFGTVALTFVALGVLGLVAMTVSRRTREVGIRIALGARSGRVAGQLAGEQVGATLMGVGVGAGLSIWALRFVQAYLYETTVYDPAVWAAALAVTLGTAGIAALLPALRASHIDPVVALRQE